MNGNIGMRVEPAREHDLPALADILRACVAAMRSAGIDQWDDLYPTPRHLAEDCAAGTLLVLRDAAAPAGLATLDQAEPAEYAAVPWTHTTAPIAIVHRLMIDPARQRRGLAKVLMQQLEAHAIAAGTRTIRLDTYAGNAPALRLYDALGYRRAGEVTFRKGRFICFEKPLSAAP